MVVLAVFNVTNKFVLKEDVVLAIVLDVYLKVSHETDIREGNEQHNIRKPPQRFDPLSYLTLAGGGGYERGS